MYLHSSHKLSQNTENRGPERKIGNLKVEQVPIGTRPESRDPSETVTTVIK